MTNRPQNALNVLDKKFDTMANVLSIYSGNFLIAQKFKNMLFRITEFLDQISSGNDYHQNNVVIITMEHSA